MYEMYVYCRPKFTSPIKLAIPSNSKTRRARLVLHIVYGLGTTTPDAGIPWFDYPEKNIQKKTQIK